MCQGNGRDHRVGQPDRASDPLQVAGDPTGQFGGGPVETKHILQGDGGQEVLQLPRALTAIDRVLALNLSWTVTVSTIALI